jgi:hypothetical protein
MNLETRVAAIEKRLQAAEDELEILRLLASYGPAADSNEIGALSRLWKADGVYNIAAGLRACGQSAIAHLFDNEHHRALIDQGSAHIVTAPRVVVKDDRAEAFAYGFLVQRAGNDYRVSRASANYWTLVRTQQGWRVEERINRVLDGTDDSRAVLRRGVSQ